MRLNEFQEVHKLLFPTIGEMGGVNHKIPRIKTQNLAGNQRINRLLFFHFPKGGGHKKMPFHVVRRERRDHNPKSLLILQLKDL